MVRFPNNFLLTMTDAPPVPPLRSVASYGGTYMVKTIPLTRGYEAIVDDEVYEEMSKYNWNTCIGCKNSSPYARTNINKKHQFMHRILMGLPEKGIVDHINGDTLDNRMINLRLSTFTGNSSNRRKSTSREYTSRYKGVSLNKRSGLWRARIAQNYKVIDLGFFKDEIEAAIAYNRAAIELHGEFCSLNEIVETTQKPKDTE